MADILSFLNDAVLPHWPFLFVAGILALIGNFTSKQLFTKERAYAAGKYQSFWWWGRESLSLHGVITGFLLGIVWRDPEGAEWTKPIISMVYFAGSGVVSLFVWTLIKSYAKSKGVELVLPGESVPPPPPTTPTAP